MLFCCCDRTPKATQGRKSFFWLRFPEGESTTVREAWQPAARAGSWKITSPTTNTKQRERERTQEVGLL